MDLKQKRIEDLARVFKMPDLLRLVEEVGMARFDKAVENIMGPYKKGEGLSSHAHTDSQKARLADSIGPFMSYYGIGCQPLTYKEAGKRHGFTMEQTRGRVCAARGRLWRHKKDLWYGIVIGEHPSRYRAVKKTGR